MVARAERWAALGSLRFQLRVCKVSSLDLVTKDKCNAGCSRHPLQPPPLYLEHGGDNKY
jgi:hypothetical protein